jgi:hypothetical protein
MRDFKGMKRQRNRGRGGGGGNGGGGGKPQHNANRAFDSNGPDNVKVRGAAQHIYEKYQQLARDAGSAGDRVLAENYLQHAEHYFRLIRAMQPQRPLSEIISRDQFASGYDIDFEEEPQAMEEVAEADAGQGERQWQDRGDGRQQGGQGEYRQDRQDRGEYRQRDQQGEYRQRDDSPRDDRQQGEYRQRDDRPRDDRPRDDRQRDDRPRDDRPRDDRPQAERQPREFQGDRNQGDRGQRYQGDGEGRQRFQGERQPRNQRDREYRDRDPLTVIEPQATPLVAPSAAYDAPREQPESVLRGEDGAMSHAPAFLQGPARADEEAAETRRPTRRRRPPRSFEADEAAAPADVDEG